MANELLPNKSTGTTGEACMFPVHSPCSPGSQDKCLIHSADETALLTQQREGYARWLSVIACMHRHKEMQALGELTHQSLDSQKKTLTGILYKQQTFKAPVLPSSEHPYHMGRVIGALSPCSRVITLARIPAPWLSA